MTYTSEKRLKSYAKRWKLNFADVKSAPQDTPAEVTTILPVAASIRSTRSRSRAKDQETAHRRAVEGIGSSDGQQALIV